MKRLFLASALLATLTTVTAQRIDINNNSGWAEERVTEQGYTPWVIITTTMATITIDGITITASVDGTPANRTLKGNWWKQGVQQQSKLTSDGVCVYGVDGTNTPQIQQGEVGITLTISGLAAGQHSLMAYHNNTDGYTGPVIDVLVNGTTVLQGVEQTTRATTPSQSGQSYIKFQAQEGEDVVVTYRTVPDPTFDYTVGYNTTSLFINALVFDRPNPKTTAADPTPAHADEHAAHTNGRATLSWTAAELGVKHHVLMGNDPLELTEKGVTAKTSYEVSDLDPMLTYYWRIDEEDKDGNIYEGDTWTFRPRRLAFPGAEGYGRWAIGGRGGIVYHVTSLDDDPSNPQPGTFRYGILNVHGPRTIVFDVAGVIHLKSRLTCSDKYVTIAGQTAPGRGIMFTGAPFGMASDGITRFIRMRVGGGDDWDGVSPNPRTSDGIGMAGNDHSIMDHCSVSWTIDEAFSSRNAQNVTLQRTLISEALNRAGHKNYVESKGPDCEHGYAATIGGDCGSYHHNLLAHCEGRNWSLSGGLDGGGNYAGRHDIFNNVVYNWGNRATDGGTHNGQFVANYYKMGPSTTQKILLKAELEGTGSGTQEYYVTGNIRENLNGSKTQDAFNETYSYKLSGGQQLTWTVFVDQPYFESQAKVQTAEQAYQSVLSDVGCNQPEIDNHDQRMISETLLRTTSTVGSRSGKKGLIDKESDAEGFAGLNIITTLRPEGWDTDQDGMPDWWETCMEGDPTTADNNRMIDGYTALEQFLNSMAEPHFVSGEEDQSIDLQPFFMGFKNPTFSCTPSMNIGSSWNIDADGKLNVSLPSRNHCTIDVTATEGSTTMTRTFRFFRSSNYVPDGIKEVSAPSALHSSPSTLHPVYNLQGQRVANDNITATRPGIYMQGGRKFVK